MKEQVLKHHTEMAECWTNVAKCCKTVSKAAKSSMKDGEEEDGANVFDTLADHFCDAAESHLAMCKAIRDTSSKKKGMGAGVDDFDFDSVMPLPTGLSAIAPDAPLARLVPRYGGAPIEKATPTDKDLARIIGTEEETA